MFRKYRKLKHQVFGLLLLVVAFGVIPAISIADNAMSSEPGTSSLAAFYTVPFISLRDHGGPILQVGLGNNLTAKFLVDTGSDTCHISEDLLSKIFASSPNHPEDKINLDEVDSITLPEIAFGDDVVDDQQFGVSKTAFEAVGAGLQFQGNLGMDFLDNFALEIDYPRHTITLITPSHLDAQTVQRIGLGNAFVVQLGNDSHRIGLTSRYKTDRYTARAEISNAGKKMSDVFLIDTGAGGTNLSQFSGDKLKLTSAAPMTLLTPINGAIFAGDSTLSSLTLGSLQLSPVSVSFDQMSSDIGSIIGENILSYCKVCFDFADKKLYILPVLPPYATWKTPDPATIDINKLRLAVPFPDVFRTEANILDYGTDRTDWTDSLAKLKSDLKGDDTDAAIYLQMAQWYRTNYDVADENHAMDECISLYKHALSLSPADSRLQGDLAEAQISIGDLDDALKILGPAMNSSQVKSVPELCAAQGELDFANALTILYGNYTDTITQPKTNSHFETLVNELATNPPNKSQADDAASDIKDAESEFDAAVSLDPKNPRWISDHLAFVANRNYYVSGVANAVNHPASYAEGQMYTPETIADSEALARLVPLPLLQSVPAQLEAYSYRFSHLDMSSSSMLGLDSLPKSLLRRIKPYIDNLNAAENGPNAADAELGLGNIERDVMVDPDGAVDDYKKSMAIAPSVEACRDLCNIVLPEEKYDDLATVLKAATAKSSDPYFIEALAAVHYKQSDAADAFVDSKQALASDPNGYLANLEMASSLLRGGTLDDSTLHQIGVCIDQVEKDKQGVADESIIEEMTIVRAYYEALSKNYDAAEADFVAILKQRPVYTDALNGLDELVPTY